MVAVGINPDDSDESAEVVSASKRPRGKYIVIEGTDGAGKTTQVESLRVWLQARGIPAEIVREPGGDPFAEQLRASILDPSHEVTPLAQHFAFQAARANLRERVIRPLLESGSWVLADRSEASTLVYQAHAGGLEQLPVWRDIVEVQTIAAPDMYLILDIDLETQAIRRPQLDEGRFELADGYFRQRVVEGYRWVVSYLQSRGAIAYLLDGRLDEDTVFKNICSYVEQFD